MTIVLRPRPLTRAAFAAFGQVIDTDGVTGLPINAGRADRFSDLAAIDVADGEGRPAISVFRSRPTPLPAAIRLVERHPWSSQAFMPLDRQPFLIVVATGENPSAGGLRAFVTRPGQGVSYARRVWHHPLLVIADEQDFLVVDRIGPGSNLEEHYFSQEVVLISCET
jgi:ureidoglycolate lyase